MSTTAEHSDPASTSVATNRARPWVVAGSLLAMAVFIVTVGFLYVQWRRNGNPNAIILVQIDMPLEGGEIWIAPMYGAGRATLKAKVGAGEAPRLVFHVPPGPYRLSVRNGSGAVLFPRDPGMGDIQAVAHAESYIELPSELLMRGGGPR